MGYVYHVRKCGKQESELEKLLLNCSHCGKAYRSRAGLEYHLKSEHAPVSRSRPCDCRLMLITHMHIWPSRSDTSHQHFYLRLQQNRIIYEQEGAGFDVFLDLFMMF